MSAVVLRGDAAHLPLPDGSVDLIVTSPPYWGVRDYRDGGESLKGQIGSEERWQDYLANLLRCTAEWARVLKPEGSLFVNMGDKYATRYSSTRGGGRAGLNDDDGTRGRSGQNRTGAGEKSLLGLPWRYALACIDDLGLILRRDIIWSKPNGLPESVTDRCRSSHEYLFHMVKQPRYYAAVDEIREPHVREWGGKPNGGGYYSTLPAGLKDANLPNALPNPLGKLPGSVWKIPSQPLTVPAHLGVDHFAAFPMELPRRIILGWSPPGICLECGKGRRPVMAEVGWTRGKSDPVRDTPSRFRSPLGRQNGNKEGKLRAIAGYACACPDPSAPTRPAVVLDPFTGTGTTLLVAATLGRIGVGVDRSADYCSLARWRTTDPGERARAMQVPKPPPVPENQGSLFDGLEAS